MDAGSEPGMTGWQMAIRFGVVEKTQTMCCISATALWQSLIKRVVKEKPSRYPEKTPGGPLMIPATYPPPP